MTKWDKVLIVVILLLSIGGTIFVSILGFSDNEKTVVIEVNGKIVKKISVNGNENGQVHDFDFGDGDKGYVEIKDGSVRMLKMDREICPAGICANTGWISKKYQSIICLPNKISVGFEQNAQGEELDIISY